MPSNIPLLDCITQSYRMAGVLTGPGRGLSDSEQQEGLHIYNAMFDGLKIERCFVYQVLRTLFDYTPTKQDYTIGSAADGADWIIERPEHILRAGVILPSGSPPPYTAEIPVEVILDYVQWYAIVTKSIPSALPRVLYYRAALPLGVASLWPVPSQAGHVTLYTPGTVDEFDDVMTTVEFPKGYREFVEYEGACKVHDRYPMVKMPPGVEMRARDMKSRIKANQLTPLFVRVDDAVMQRRPDTGTWWDARTWVP